MKVSALKITFYMVLTAILECYIDSITLLNVMLECFVDSVTLLIV